MIKEERFKPLYLHNYGMVQVGEFGTIIGKKGNPLKPSNNSQKHYYRVHLGKKFYPVHRLVAIAWIPNPYPETRNQVNHIDGNKANNSKDNLEWVSNSENKHHADMNDLSYKKITYKDAEQIRNLYLNSDKKLTYFDLAEMYGISYSMVGYIVRKHSWRA